MPIYEYQCQACGHQLESFEKITDSPLTDCPECGKSTLQKLVSAAGFQLKGSGWYATDFKKSDSAPKKENASPKTDTSSTSTTTTSSSTEAKS